MMTDQEKFWNYLKNGHQTRLKIYGQPLRIGEIDPTILKQLVPFFMKNKKRGKAMDRVWERKQ